jgi:hypothetical protein
MITRTACQPLDSNEQGEHTMQRIAFIIAILGAAGTVSAPAAIYRWVDSHGHIHFADSPPSLRQTHKVAVDDRPIGYTGLTRDERAALRRDRELDNRRRKDQRADDARAARARHQRAADAKRCAAARRRLDGYWDERHRGCKPSRCRRIDHQLEYYRGVVGKYCH